MSIYKIAFKKVISKDFTERYTYRIQLKNKFLLHLGRKLFFVLAILIKLIF